LSVCCKDFKQLLYYQCFLEWLGYCYPNSMTEKIIVTAWNDIVSPLFDSANLFIVITEHNQRVVFTSSGNSVIEKVETIKKSDSKVVICGAISNLAMTMLIDSGIKVISGIRGNIECVISAYIDGTLTSRPQFLFPGCGCHNRKNGRMGIVNCMKGKSNENSCNGNGRKRKGAA